MKAGVYAWKMKVAHACYEVEDDGMLRDALDGSHSQLSNYIRSLVAQLFNTL